MDKLYFNSATWCTAMCVHVVCLRKPDCVWCGPNLNRQICILLLSQRHYWFPVVVTWNFACTGTVQMVAPYDQPNIAQPKCERLTFTAAHMQCVTRMFSHHGCSCWNNKEEEQWSVFTSLLTNCIWGVMIWGLFDDLGLLSYINDCLLLFIVY